MEPGWLVVDGMRSQSNSLPFAITMAYGSGNAGRARGHRTSRMPVGKCAVTDVSLPAALRLEIIVMGNTTSSLSRQRRARLRPILSS